MAYTAKKCQMTIMGAAGTEILKHRAEAFIVPRSENEITARAESFVLSISDEYQPFCRLLVSKHEMKHLVLSTENFDVPVSTNAFLAAENHATHISIDMISSRC